jgi:class III poly(R)-hydroxyalkanoic acid synthase PhaE subunit
MEQNLFSSLGFDPLIATWMKVVNDSLGEYGKRWQGLTRTESNRDSGGSNIPADSLESLLKTWRMVSSTFSHEDTVGSTITGLGELPSVMMKFAQTQVEGYSRAQQQMLDKIKATKTDPKLQPFSLIDNHLYAEWQSFYEQELSQYFHLPQLGLTRFHQEKLNRLLDKYNRMHTTVGEFMAMLFQPVERSFRILQDKYLELADKNELSDNAKDYYKLWIGILEKDFASFFKSPEYLVILTKTLNSIAEFKARRDEIIQDLLVDLPIPSQKEMNELYKEVYRLKKRIRDLEKGERGTKS